MQNFLVEAEACHLAMTELDLGLIQKSHTLAISGLTYIPNYIDVNEQNQLLKVIDQQVWSLESTESQRRIQQHGYRYDYKNGILVAASHLGSLPDWLQRIARRLKIDGFIKTVPDQVTINEYEPGQGLTSHIDCVTCFGDTVLTLSLGSSSVMEFTHAKTKEKKEVFLSPSSLLVLQREARYLWQHNVAPRQMDTYNGREFIRTRRVAITFREALFPHK